MSEKTPGPAGFSWQQGVALLVGAFYLVFGVVGFFFVRDLSAAVTGRPRTALLGVDLNGVQNFLHVVLGVLGLLMSTGERPAPPHRAHRPGHRRSDQERHEVMRS